MRKLLWETILLLAVHGVCVQARVLNDAAFMSADSQRYLNTGCRG